MITNISIKNYKSIVNANLPLGRFNVLIGENGCGKSNLLESVTMAAAAESNKLEFEYFANRGIRLVPPKLMLPAFPEVEADKVEITIEDGKRREYKIRYDDNLESPKWVDENYHLKEYDLGKVFGESSSVRIEQLMEHFEKITPQDGTRTVFSIGEGSMLIKDTNRAIEQFLVYAPEESKLRQLTEKNRIHPLGRQGEGLLDYIIDLSSSDSGISTLNEITENLRILDWFDDFGISGSNKYENDILLKDRYTEDTLTLFTQHSANEGFLYLLFYFTLLTSKQTPKFFAIENIDSALNPKLCRELVGRMVALAKKHDKQLIVTTHNPAILDGLDMNDEEQRLLVVSRNTDGYTKVRAIENSKLAKSEKPLSELWTKGFIGGLPNNF